jgi:hypothetical protein
VRRWAVGTGLGGRGQNGLTKNPGFAKFILGVEGTRE